MRFGVICEVQSVGSGSTTAYRRVSVETTRSRRQRGRCRAGNRAATQFIAGRVSKSAGISDSGAVRKGKGGGVADGRRKGRLGVDRSGRQGVE